MIWLRSKGYKYKEIAGICNVRELTLSKYIKGFRLNGVTYLKQLNWQGQPSELNSHIDVIKRELESNPPSTAAEASEQIFKLTGIKRCPTQIRIFLKKKLSFKLLKTGSIPGNGKNDDKEKEAERDEFKKKKLMPELEKAEKNEQELLFMDAAHFIFATFMGYLWCISRIFLKSHAGRKRYNCSGLLTAGQRKFLSLPMTQNWMARASAFS